MIEKQTINGKDVWIKVDPHPVERENAHVIPTEYFTATYFVSEPTAALHTGREIRDEQGELRLFESPVAALAAAKRQLDSETDHPAGVERRR